MKWFALVSVMTLVACGVDGAPTAPEPEPKPKTGVQISGSASAGVKARL